MVDELGLKQNEKKLVFTLQDTKNYVLHYKNLQFYLNQGIKLKKVLYRHRNDPHHRNDPRHRNDPQSPPK